MSSEELFKMLTGPSIGGLLGRVAGPIGATGPPPLFGINGGPVSRIPLEETNEDEFKTNGHRPGRKVQLDLIEDDLINFRMLMPNGKIGEVAIRGVTVAQIIADRCLEEEKKAKAEENAIDIQVGEGFSNEVPRTDRIIDSSAIISASSAIAKRSLQNVIDPTKMKKSPFDLYGESNDTIDGTTAGEIP